MFSLLSEIYSGDWALGQAMEKQCEICDLPHTTRKEIEGMLLEGWIPLDLEHWIALRFRLKISASGIQNHYEQCYRRLSSGRELLEVARLVTSLSLPPRTIEDGS